MRLIFNTSDQPDENRPQENQPQMREAEPPFMSPPVTPHEAACMCDDCLEILTRPDSDAEVCDTPHKAQEVPSERLVDRSIGEQKGEEGATPAEQSAWDRENEFVTTSSDRDELRELLRAMPSKMAYNWWDGTAYEAHLTYTVLINQNGGRITVGVKFPKLVSEIAVDSGKIDELLKKYNLPSPQDDDCDDWGNEGGYFAASYDYGGEG